MEAKLGAVSIIQAATQSFALAFVLRLATAARPSRHKGRNELTEILLRAISVLRGSCPASSGGGNDAVPRCPACAAVK